MKSILGIMAVCSLSNFLAGGMEKQYLREGRKVGKQMLTGILLSLTDSAEPQKRKLS